MFLKNGGSNGDDSGDFWLFEIKKSNCSLISIDMSIARTTETAKFRKLKEWQHFEVKISIFLVLFVFWVG